MKIKNLFIMSLAAFSFVACSNDEELSVPQTADVVVNLASVAPETKATTKASDFEGDALNSLAAEKSITFGSLYVFEGETFITKVAITSASVSVPKLTVGKSYTFAAAVNTTDPNVTTIADLKEAAIALGNSKDVGSFVMYGDATAEIAEAGEPATPTDVTITVKRVRAGVQLVSIKTNFGAEVPVYAREGEAFVKSLKILGTNPTSKLDGGVIAANTDNINGIDASFGTTGLSFDSNVTSVSVEDNSVRAYCCPGALTYVVLNVTYKYEEKDYDRVYNITTLNTLNNNAGLLANTLYGLKVVLTGAGSGEEGKPDEFNSAEVTLAVADWSNGQIHDVPNQEN